MVLMTVWAGRNGQPAPNPVVGLSILVWTALCLATIGAVMASVITIRLQEYQYVPGIVILLVYFFFLFRTWRQRAAR